MHLNNDHRKRLVAFYFICFAVYYACYFFNGNLLHEFNPVFFHNRLDLTSNIVWFTNIQSAVLHNALVCHLMDGLFIALPFLMFLSVYCNLRAQYLLAVVTSLYNLFYAVVLSSVSLLSIEGFTGWMLLPLMFAFKGERSFYFAMHCMRYFFIIVFVSAGLWKIRAGGIFNQEQMSAILVQQHAAYLVSQPQGWFGKMIAFLINHGTISYTIYLLATIGELIFITGFFTKKFDRYLIIIFSLFVILDYFLMQINYFSWLAFMGCFFYSRLKCATAAA